MKVELIRFHHQPIGGDPEESGVLGLLLINTLFACFTLENRLRQIDARDGYQLRLSHSPKFSPRYGHLMVEVVEPGTERLGERDQILFHRGNEANDSRGCILLGGSVQAQPEDGRYIVFNSKEAYDRVYKVLAYYIQRGVVDFSVRTIAEMQTGGLKKEGL